MKQMFSLYELFINLELESRMSTKFGSCFQLCDSSAFMCSNFFFAGYASAGSSSTSSSDGSGQTFTQTSNNGQGQFTYTQNKPGSVPIIATGNLPPNSIPPNSIPPYFGPANFGQPSFGYGPSYPFNPYGSMAPAFTPYPQQPAFGFNSPFQPLQPLSPYQPFNTFLTPTPQEFSAYLNAVQQQYNTYVLLCFWNIILKKKTLKFRFFLLI